MFNVFAVATPGLEAVLESELSALGVRKVRPEVGGFSLRVPFRKLCELNLRSRIGCGFLVRLFHGRILQLNRLDAAVAGIRWSDYLAASSPVQIRVTAKKSRLYHSGAIRERVGRGITTNLGAEPPWVSGNEIPAGLQKIVVRNFRDQLTISIDSSGEHLHRRGYRTLSGKAPLRENIAAGCLALLGYVGDRPFLDPMSGSGTLGIEAAMIARNIPPGMRRRFALMDWPVFAPEDWERVKTRLMAGVREHSPPILCSDRHPGSGKTITANAEKAGLSATISCQRLSFGEAVESVPSGQGMCLVNPPYGGRIGDAGGLERLYRALDSASRGPLAGWRMGVVTENRRLMERHCPNLTPISPPIFHGGKRVYLYSSQ